MKQLFFALILIFSAFACKDKAATSSDAEAVATAAGEAYNVQVDLSLIKWEGSKPTGKHSGSLKIKDGQIFISNRKITAGSFTIDMNSITCEDLSGDDKAGLEGHLKGLDAEGADDFFNVTKFPTGKFEITSVIDTLIETGGNAVIKGNLTLKDVTKEIAIPVLVNFTDDMVIAISNPFTINRTDWGINYKSKNVFKELGDKFINDDIGLQISIKAKKENASTTKPAQ